ncbi:DUF4145 domain-containing protein [Diaphorobacter sp. HDW4A]|uniref:DUF4145 domain-containing protein n=1 Tax=Diaphorobacter sp. HDW4A TaxID=2714924 RepID=UPI00140B95B8|nr:DUF4145 domain-containing protein [Diaphorobacter sp. HDW4A]QIL78580.1 DUF4145 domain-containing protein [Diaphorobacter sp. HDW4A]
MDGSVISLGYKLIECPNTSCKKQSFEVTATHGRRVETKLGGYTFVEKRPVGIGKFTFLPTSSQPLSIYVPKHVAEDYNEASLISSLSPKASATLARRALQGMVRDFFQVAGKRTLHQELEAVKNLCDADLYDAMMAVKSVGNIGAHPEQDVSLMVDVELGEAETLLNLIHLLDQEWYVARATKSERIAKMKALGVAKQLAITATASPTVQNTSTP